MIWKLICAIVGHKLHGNDGIAGAHDCTRCGFHIPAIVWPRGHVPPKYPPGLQSPTRPAPPMPACKPPTEDRITTAVQVLTVQAGDMVVITSGRIMGAEQRDKLASFARKGLPDGVKVLVLDAGMSLSVVRHEDIVTAPMSSLGSERK